MTVFFLLPKGTLLHSSWNRRSKGKNGTKSLGRRRGGGDQSVENSQFMGWTTGLESTQKLGEKGIDLTRVKGQTDVSKEVVDNMFFFHVGRIKINLIETPYLIVSSMQRKQERAYVELK